MRKIRIAVDFKRLDGTRHLRSFELPSGTTVFHVLKLAKEDGLDIGYAIVLFKGKPIGLDRKNTPINVRSRITVIECERTTSIWQVD